ncbi:hypothetical protein B5F35_01515 [Anaeromassilibacillus sp. An200]|nr:hypothetical protein B5F35_01515 [Anaeromassilibacillus sp. An200]
MSKSLTFRYLSAVRALFYLYESPRAKMRGGAVPSEILSYHKRCGRAMLRAQRKQGIAQNLRDKRGKL